MDVKVRFNGMLSSLLGRAQLTASIAEPASVADLIALIAQQHPAAAAALAGAVPVVGGEVVSRQAPLADGQELGLLMPISGG